MPIYDFICLDCGNRFDKLTGFNWQQAGIKCPDCQSDKLIRPVTAACIKSAAVTGRPDQMSISSTNSACANCHGGNCKTCH